MDIKEPYIELEGVSGVLLDPSGKCIITLRSDEYLKNIYNMKTILEQLSSKINEIEKRIADDNKYKKTRLNDLENILIKERFDGIMQNMESMQNAILVERKR